MLPGVAPTYRKVQIPLVGISGLREDKLVPEHIFRDQTSEVKQIGLRSGASRLWHRNGRKGFRFQAADWSCSAGERGVSIVMRTDPHTQPTHLTRWQLAMAAGNWSR